MRFSRIAHLIDNYGVGDGLRLYMALRRQHVSPLKITGISLPIFLRKNTTDIAMFEQVFLQQDYNIPYSFTPDTIIDAGANVGLFSIWMKSKFPNANIICVEPDRENYEALQKNINSYTGVEAMNAGLWHLETKLNIIDKYNAGHSAMAVEEDPMNGTVRAVTVDSLLQAHGLDHIDILKIDIETSEKDVFSKNYESWLPKVKVIIIELHDWLRPGCSRVFFEAINQCWKNYSYSVRGENTMIENKDLTGSQES